MKRSSLRSAVTIANAAVTSTASRAYVNTSYSPKSCSAIPTVDLNWYPPNQTQVNNLSSVLHDQGVYGLILNSSITPDGLPYSTYNYCNMPHVRAQEYIVPASNYELAYVEVIHRHHKRTPYASNTFPVEPYPWHCDDQSLYYYGTPSDNQGAKIAWHIEQNPTNPFQPTGFQNSTCQFPQITNEGLLDSRQHGIDLASVYLDKLNFLTTKYDPTLITFRVTNNIITSQVASQIAIGLYPSLTNQQLNVTLQPEAIDSLEPQYPCPSATTLRRTYSINSTSPLWLAHLQAPETKSLFAHLDAISGIPPSSKSWHTWADHYFDILSSRLCHAKPLPCSATDPIHCITPASANAVFRLGLYEYSYIHRDHLSSLRAATAAYGVYIAEIAANLRDAMSGTGSVMYRHNVAHDGSMALLLSILQAEVMVWPGMGSEVVFELWRERGGGCWVVRVLWGGVVLGSANPGLGRLDMVPVEVLLGYFDGLVGVRAERVPGLCEEED